MMNMLEELLKAKKASSDEMDPMEADAKMSVLKEIRDLAAGKMGDQIRGMKQVTVAAPDAPGLAKGLDEAKNVVGKEGSPEEEASESPIEEKKEDDLGDMSADEIDALMQMLQDKKAKLATASDKPLKLS